MKIETNTLTGIAVHLDNLEILDRRKKINDAQKDLSVDMLSELLPKGNDVRESYRLFCDTYQDADVASKAGFCHRIFKRSGKDEEYPLIYDRQDSVPAGAHGKIAIVRNRYNEAAYAALSKLVSRAKVVYASSFVSACEDVYDGKCQYCILPVADSQNGRMFGFYSTIDRFELHVCASCNIDAESAAESVKYALIGRVIPDRTPKNTPRRFEFSVISHTGRVISDIIEAASVFGADLSGIDSLPVEYGDGLQKYYFTFRLPAADIRGLDLYLSEEYASYAPVGYYPVTKTKN